MSGLVGGGSRQQRKHLQRSRGEKMLSLLKAFPLQGTLALLLPTDLTPAPGPVTLQCGSAPYNKTQAVL